MTEGNTAAEAVDNLADAMREWLRVQIEDGERIPPPAETLSYSGKFMLRVTPRLHREATELAARERVSLNAFVAMALARAVGERSQQFSYGQLRLSSSDVTVHSVVASWAQYAVPGELSNPAMMVAQALIQNVPLTQGSPPLAVRGTVT